MMKQSEMTLTCMHEKDITPSQREALKKFYPDKNESFYLSRLCLLRSLGEGASIKQLNLKHHQFLDSYPDDRFSLSHTKSFAVVLRTKKRSTLGIGVDCEKQDRKMKDGACKYFLSKKDSTTLSPLECWSVKEAGFKAFSNANLPIQLIKEVIIMDDTLRFQDQCAHFHIRYQEGFLISSACVERDE